MTRACASCGTNSAYGARYCTRCGQPLLPIDRPPSRLTPVTIHLLAGRRADYYVRAFSRMYPTGTVTLKPSWNWAAFFFGFVWMLYRGLFFEGIGLLVSLSLLGFWHLPLWPLFILGQGIFGNAIYFLALERRRRRSGSTTGEAPASEV